MDDLSLTSVTVDPFNRALVILTVRTPDDTVFAVLGIRPEPDTDPTTVAPVAIYQS
jgi:hypothetical protein